MLATASRVLRRPRPQPSACGRLGCGWPGLVLAATALAPAAARAGGEVAILADVLLAQPETYEGGSLIGPPESRATWYHYGGIAPFDGSAMLVLSTGQVGGDPMPGSDLGAAGAENDIAGLNLSLLAPDDARSMRIAVRVLAPTPSEAPELAGDQARVLVQGDPIALDPSTLGSLEPGTQAMGTATAEETQGTPFASPDGVGSGWIEAVVAIEPGSLVAVRVETRDGSDSALGDFVMLADGLLFDTGIPEGVRPGVVPLLARAQPERLPELLPVTVLLSGRGIPPDVRVSLVDADGATAAELDGSDVHWLSTEQVEVDLPALEQGPLDVRLAWQGGAIRWPAALEVDTPPPRITGVNPDTGPASGGGLVAVAGLGFIEVSRLTIDDEEVDEFAVVGPELLEFVVPPGEPGPADLAVFAHGGFAEAQGIYVRAGLAPPEDEPQDEPGTGPLDCSSAGPAGEASTALVLLVLLVLGVRDWILGRLVGMFLAGSWRKSWPGSGQARTSGRCPISSRRVPGSCARSTTPAGRSSSRAMAAAWRSWCRSSGSRNSRRKRNARCCEGHWSRARRTWPQVGSSRTPQSWRS